MTHPGHQFDLFSDVMPEAPAPLLLPERSRMATAELDDDSLLAAIPRASLGDVNALVQELLRRGLPDAVSALEALCRRFKGFGRERAMPEQEIALAGLVSSGGCEAANAVARIITQQVVEGPGLRGAADAAAKLGARLPADVVRALLQHPLPAIRASACRYAGPQAGDLRIELLSDLTKAVSRAACCALGRLGWGEARPGLIRLLCENPAEDVMDAVVGVADEQCLVLLGRTARTRPELAPAALAALEGVDMPRAASIAASVRTSIGSQT